MSEIISHVNPKSEAYRANYTLNKTLADELQARQKAAAAERPQRIIDRQRERGKLLVRERIEALLDTGSPFWSCRRWRPGRCTRAKRRARAS